MSKVATSQLSTDEIEEPEKEETVEEQSSEEAQAEKATEKATETTKEESEAKEEAEESKTDDTFTQKELADAVTKERERVRSQFKDYDDLKEKAEKVDTLTTEVADLRTENLRLQVAIEKGIPLSIADRIKGSTREELEADADTLSSVVKQKPAGSFDGGVRETAPKTANMADFLQGAVLSE